MWTELQPGVFVAELPPGQGVAIRSAEPSQTLVLKPSGVIKLVEFFEAIVEREQKR